ncbi:hypothetical protein ACWKSP_20150 [Micromonosporaceae bacterium Da 78-11]
MVHLRVPLTAALLLTVAGCAADKPGPTPEPAPTDSCPASAELGDGLPDRQGVGEGATLWAMFFGPKAVAGQEFKIAWRMTGAGDLAMTATGPDGSSVTPTWGPEPHSESTFDRPGDEWGTGWVFPTAGYWTVNAARNPGSAQLTLRVAAA